MSICYCGAYDCPHCHPELFVRGIYIGDCETEAEVEALLEDEADRRADQ
jgi:hypothetical protein